MRFDIEADVKIIESIKLMLNSRNYQKKAETTLKPYKTITT